MSRLVLWTRSLAIAYSILFWSSKKLHLTAVFVTHDVVEAVVLGIRIAVMKNGTIVQIGTPQELILDPVNEYVEQLMNTPKRQAKLVDELIKGSSS